MSIQRAGVGAPGGTFEEWESHSQWMEYDAFEEVRSVLCPVQK